MNQKPNSEALHAGNCPKSFEDWWNDHENGCPTLVLDNDEQFARAVWNAALADLRNNLRSELTTVTEQRDRLAVVLQNIRSGYGGQIPIPACDCGDCELLITIDNALQYITKPN